MTMPVLAVEDLGVAFRRGHDWHPVVRNVSFEVAPRETLAVVGESGSGKSVTALSIMRLLSHCRTSGSIRFGGVDVLALPEARMREVRGNEVAMIFQEPMTSLNPLLTIGFQITEALRCHRSLSKAEAEAETLRLLDRVRIPAAKTRFDEHPHKFSGGMRQRVMIAMALACRPKLLIADEPTTALDVTIQSQILALIKELQEEDGMSVLFITHDMGVVAEIADRAVVMYRGDLIETADTIRLFKSPVQAYTRDLLAAVPRLGAMQDKLRPQRFPTIDRISGAILPAAEARDTVDAGQTRLEVRGLTTRFDVARDLFGKVTGRVHAVEDVSFSLAAGETLALVGESGCGKSTIGRSVLGLARPTSGAVLVDGEEADMASRASLRQLRRRVQMVFQDPYASLNPRIPVGQAIAEPIVSLGLDDRRGARRTVAELLEKVGLTDDMTERYPHEFSGGQRQRICIARALASRPGVLVADEAISALDVSVKSQIVNLMLDLQEHEGLSYLFISHDMAAVERISHRVAVMYLGEIVEIGPRAAVFGNPQHAYTRRLLSAVPVPDPERRVLHRPLLADEIKSPIRAAAYVPPPRRYREVSPAHLVQTSE